LPYYTVEYYTKNGEYNINVEILGHNRSAAISRIKRKHRGAQIISAYLDRKSVSNYSKEGEDLLTMLQRFSR
jgi:hypothetical protein